MEYIEILEYLLKNLNRTDYQIFVSCRKEYEDGISRKWTRFELNLSFISFLEPGFYIEELEIINHRKTFILTKSDLDEKVKSEGDLDGLIKNSFLNPN